MSIKHLFNVTEVSHTRDDDMESLLYVILFCAMTWLGHNLSKDALEKRIEDFFDSRHEKLGSIDTFGGDSKWNNAQGRQLTQDIRWNNAAVGDWFNTVLDFFRIPILRRPREARWEHIQPWHDLDALEPYWASFLRERDSELGTDDRVDLPSLLHARDASGAVPGIPADGLPLVMAPTNALGKRSSRSSSPEDVSVPPLKRTRRSAPPSEPDRPLPRRSPRKPRPRS